MALNRIGIESIYVDASAVIRPLQLRHSDSTLINNDADDANGDESDDEDEILMEYCSDEEEYVHMDLDIDIKD